MYKTWLIVRNQGIELPKEILFHTFKYSIHFSILSSGINACSVGHHRENMKMVLQSIKKICYRVSKAYNSSLTKLNKTQKSHITH